MLRAGCRAKCRLPGQVEPIAAALAFGFVDPSGETADAGLVGDSGYLMPVEQYIGAEWLFVFAHQQRVATSRW